MDFGSFLVKCHGFVFVILGAPVPFRGIVEGINHILPIGLAKNIEWYATSIENLNTYGIHVTPTTLVREFVVVLCPKCMGDDLVEWGDGVQSLNIQYEVSDSTFDANTNVVMI
jgi:hypothetical protein